MAQTRIITLAKTRFKSTKRLNRFAECGTLHKFPSKPKSGYLMKKLWFNTLRIKKRVSHDSKQECGLDKILHLFCLVSHRN